MLKNCQTYWYYIWGYIFWTRNCCEQSTTFQISTLKSGLFSLSLCLFNIPSVSFFLSFCFLFIICVSSLFIASMILPSLPHSSHSLLLALQRQGWPHGATNGLSNRGYWLEMCECTKATPQPPHRAVRGTFSREK